MEKDKPQSKYGQWIIGMMLVAYLATSFDYRTLLFQAPLLTVGSKKMDQQYLVQRIREEKAYAQLMISPPALQGSDIRWMQKVAMDEVWDQETEAMGIVVSENRARASLREKMCFLNEDGKMDRPRMMAFYQKNPLFFNFDFQATEENAGFLMGDGARTPLFRGKREFLGPQDCFDEGKMGAFLRKNGVSLLQMIGAEQRLLRRMALKNALAKNVVLPSFYKELATKGQQQGRSWRSRFFPLEDADLAKQTVSKENVALFLKKGLPQSMKSCPEMRTFTVMCTENFSTLSPSSKKNGTSEWQTMIEDAIGAGKRLEEVAQSKECQGRAWKYAVLTSSAAGLAPDFSPISWNQQNGQPLLSQDVRKKILERVFSSQEGVFTLPVNMGGMAWVQVHTIEPARALTEKELYAAAEYTLKVQNHEAAVEAKAQAFAKNLNPKSMTDHTAYAPQVTEGSAPEGASRQAMMAAFRLTPPPTTCVIRTPGGYEVIELLSVSEKPEEGSQGSLDAATIEKALERQWRAAFFQAYTRILQKKHAIVANDKALQEGFNSGMFDQASDGGGDDEA